LKLSFDDRMVTLPGENESKMLSRLGCTKQLFHAFLNRSAAYDFVSHIGLVTFGSEVKYNSQLSPFYERFTRVLDTQTAGGATKLYDALRRSVKELEKWRLSHPSAPRCRILCISDGNDTDSKKASAEQLFSMLRTANVTLDVVALGQNLQDSKLRALAKSSGGQYFHPKMLRNALKLCELDTTLCVLERSPPPPTARRYTQLRSYLDERQFPPDVCDDANVPPRKKKEEPALAATSIGRAVRVRHARARRGRGDRRIASIGVVGVVSCASAHCCCERRVAAQTRHARDAARSLSESSANRRVPVRRQRVLLAVGGASAFATFICVLCTLHT
jgi:uncharacterized protein YegL